MGHGVSQRVLHGRKSSQKITKTRRNHAISAGLWSEWRDLNPRPLGPEYPSENSNGAFVSVWPSFPRILQRLHPVHSTVSTLIFPVVGLVVGQAQVAPIKICIAVNKEPPYLRQLQLSAKFGVARTFHPLSEGIDYGGGIADFPETAIQNYDILS